VKITICDLCAVQKKIAFAKWRVRHKGSGAVAIALCLEHKGWGKGKSREEMFRTLVEAETAMNEMERS